MKQTIAPVKVAIIGAGRMGSLYGQLSNELALTRLMAICGEDEGATATMAESLEVPGYGAGRYTQMLNDLPELEAVVVATPEWAHTKPVMAALEAGKHVLVEKPLASSPDEASQMTTSAERLGRTLMVCHSVRFNPRFALMQRAVVQGSVGRVVHMYARRHSLQGAVDRVLGHVPLSYWLAPHDIDLLMWTARSPVRSVWAVSPGASSTRSGFISAVLHFANGAEGILETSWCAPSTGGRPNNELFTVRGDGGAIEVLGNEQGLAIYQSGSTALYPDTIHAPCVHGHTEGPYRSLLRHFAGGIRGLWAPFMSPREAAHVIDVAYAMDRSLSTGDEVEVITSLPLSC